MLQYLGALVKLAPEMLLHGVRMYSYKRCSVLDSVKIARCWLEQADLQNFAPSQQHFSGINLAHVYIVHS